MKLYYTYGRPQLLVKNITTRYYNEYRGVHNIDIDTFIKNQTSKLKGWFIPNLWLGNGPIQITDSTWCSYDRLVKTYIAAVFIDWYVVNNACSLHISKPLAKFIKHDIDLLVFNRESFITGAYAQYMEFWNKHYGYIIDKMYIEIVDNWNGKVPSAYIQGLFTNSYTYKKRKRKSKWSWLKDYRPEEIARRILDEGKLEIESAMVSAMKHLHLSVKAVQVALNDLIGRMSACEIEVSRKRAGIKLWASKLQYRQLCDIKLYFDMADTLFIITLTRAYGLEDSLLHKGCTEFIKTTVTEQFKEFT